jgi:hypothetical protein
LYRYYDIEEYRCQEQVHLASPKERVNATQSIT